MGMQSMLRKNGRFLCRHSRMEAELLGGAVFSLAAGQRVSIGIGEMQDRAIEQGLNQPEFEYIAIAAE